MKAALALGALVACFVFAQSANLGFTSAVSDQVARAYALRFGAPAQERIAAWQAFAQARKADFKAPDSGAGALVTINRFFNRLPFVSDLSHWQSEDYWATPAEFVASNGGDCEDFSVAKYFLLKELGVPIDKLRITYVTAKRLNQAHMVLAYYPTPDADPLILDNLENTVRPASQRTDLVPVYSFNDDELWLAQRGRVGSPAQIRMWRGLLEKLEREAHT
jgi:predicted transglutaminase-like cysteine proteinase